MAFSSQVKSVGKTWWIGRELVAESKSIHSKKLSSAQSSMDTTWMGDCYMLALEFASTPRFLHSQILQKSFWWQTVNRGRKFHPLPETNSSGHQFSTLSNEISLSLSLPTPLFSFLNHPFTLAIKTSPSLSLPLSLSLSPETMFFGDLF